MSRFAIPFDGDAAGDLRSRLAAVRWPDATSSGWDHGTQESFLRGFIAYWSDAYDWSARVTALNTLPHHRASLGGFGVHFLHFRSPSKNAVPLLLMNGWPSSFVEYLKIAPLLSEGDPAFHVVIPALPGFGFSDRPTRPYQVEPADLFPALMGELGYKRFIAAGTDFGSGVATRIGLRHADRAMGIHVGTVAERPARPGESPPSPQERRYQELRAVWDREEGAYQALQSSKPQSLAFALTDSPVGMAGWILEKYHGWSDCGGDVLSVFPLEFLADNLSIYWMTQTMASSMRFYYDAARLRPKIKAEDFVSVPTAVGVWPRDIAVAPRSLAERMYNVRRFTQFPRGGHFPAWEAPELYAADLRSFAAEVG